jgi:hypothetical protein
MDDRTDISSDNHRLRFELIFASVWLAIGLFVVPALVFWVGIVLLGPYGDGRGAGMATFYGDFYADLASGEVRAWVLALGPLLLITLIRGVFIGARSKRSPTSEVKEPPRAPPVSSKGTDGRRVEPRIGTE